LHPCMYIKHVLLKETVSSAFGLYFRDRQIKSILFAGPFVIILFIL
jgi:hypothetical protein